MKRSMQCWYEIRKGLTSVPLLLVGLLTPLGATQLAQAQTPQSQDRAAPSQQPAAPTATPGQNPSGTPNRPARLRPARPEADPQLLRPVYLLGPGDEIEVTVLDYPEFTGPRVVLPDGTVTLPVVGSVNASGKTTEQLAQELNSRLQPFLVNPVTTVSLNTLRPVSVTVSGEVLRPGPVQLRSLTDNSNQDTPETMPTVSLAVIQAGGITQYADLRSVTLTRRTPEGDSQQMTLNLWEAIGSPNPPPDLTLQDGDAIYIPRLAQGDTLDRRLASRSSYAPATVRVRVVGEVNAPGEVQVPPNSSISSAVAIAGGPTEDARLREVAFVRLDESGEISRETIDLRNLTDSYQVQEGDVVIVPKRGSSSLIDLAGRVLSPLNVLLNLFD